MSANHSISFPISMDSLYESYIRSGGKYVPKEDFYRILEGRSQTFGGLAELIVAVVTVEVESCYDSGWEAKEHGDKPFITQLPPLEHPQDPIKMSSLVTEEKD